MAYYGNAPADVALVVGSDVITTTEIQDATIATADIANDAITAVKIDDDGTGFQMGSLGLGTAVSGSEKLTVGGTASFTGDITGTLATASQGNITSVGTLTGLTVSGDTSNGSYLGNINNTGTQSEDNGLKIQIASSGSSAHGLKVQTGGSANAFIVSGDGQVGVGLSSSAMTDTFNVNGTFSATGNATFDGTITNTPNTSGDYAMFVNQQNSAGWGLRVAGGTDNDDYIIRGQDGSGNDKFQVKSGGNIVLGDDKLLVNATGQTNINVAGISGWGAEIHNAYNSASDVHVYLGYANSSGRNSGMNITMDDANSNEYLASWNSGGVNRFKMDGVGETEFTGNVKVNGSDSVQKVYRIPHGNTSPFTHTVNAESDLKGWRQGGIAQLIVTGYLQEYWYGIIRWANNGGGSTNLNNVDAIALSNSGITVSVAVGSGDNDIDITFTGIHANDHGYVANILYDVYDY